MSGKTIKVTLVRGTTAILERHRATVRGLGFKRREQTVELIDTPAVRGMINQVRYLLKVEG